MWDVVLHVPLGLGAGLMMVTISLSLTPGLAVALNGCLYIYLREVDQRQTKANLSFGDLRGWLPWLWKDEDGLKVHKILETFIPMVPMVLIGYWWDQGHSLPF